MTWGVSASPEQMSPESLSFLSPILRGETGPSSGGPRRSGVGAGSLLQCVLQGTGLHVSLGPLGGAHLARAGVLPLGPQQRRRQGGRAPRAGGGAAPWPALSGPGCQCFCLPGKFLNDLKVIPTPSFVLRAVTFVV